jgi:hypothetical protein
MKTISSLLLATALISLPLAAQTHPAPKRTQHIPRISKQDISGKWDAPFVMKDSFGNVIYYLAILDVHQDGDHVDFCSTNEDPIHCFVGQYVDEKTIFVTQYEPPNIPGNITLLIDDQKHFHTSGNMRYYSEGLLEDVENCPNKQGSNVLKYSFLTRMKTDKTMYRTLSSDDPADVRSTSPLRAWSQGHAFFAEGKYSDALFWYERAAAQGSADAALEIGLLYEHGQGVGKDLPMAMRWHNSASDAGNALATNRLSTMYFQGFGIEKDPLLGAQYETRAYCFGESLAAFGFYIQYARGAPGVAKDPAAAELWRDRHVAELAKAQKTCERTDVREQMAALMTLMYLRLLTSPNAIESLSGLMGLNTPNPEYEDRRVVISSWATQRHGPGEVECDAMFSTAPKMWSFRVNHVSGINLVTPATGAQWFALSTYRVMLGFQGIPEPIGLHNMYDLEQSTSEPAKPKPPHVPSERGCYAEGSLKSPAAKEIMNIRFTNNGTTPVHIYWISFEGKRILYKLLNPGLSYLQPSYVGHFWVITGASDECRKLVSIDQNVSEVNIQ